MSALLILGCNSAMESAPSYVIGSFKYATRFAMLSRGGVAKLKASTSKPTFGFVFVRPPT
eukprot:scaffold327044_cov569-Tisochrysis_lutea.AAC.3